MSFCSRIGWLCLLVSLVAPLEAAPGNAQRQVKEKPSVGRVLMVSGKGHRTLIRNGKRIQLSAESLKKSVFLLYEGDRFEEANTPVIRYVDQQGYWTNPQQESAPHSPSARKGKPIPKVFTAKRNLAAGPAREPENRLIGKADQVNQLHLGNGDPFQFQLAWWSRSGVQAKRISLLRQKDVLIAHEVKQARVSQKCPVSLYADAELADVVVTKCKGSEFTVRVDFSDNTSDSLKYRLFDGDPVLLDWHGRELRWVRREQGYSGEWLDSAIAAANAYESAGCISQALILVMEWWLSDPESGAATELLGSIAVECGLAAPERYCP